MSLRRSVRPAALLFLAGLVACEGVPEGHTAGASEVLTPTASASLEFTPAASMGLPGEDAVRGSVGRIGGDSPEVFGRIVDVEIDASGRYYVLDRRNREIRVFGPDGGHVSTAGGRGGGPGEFLRPLGLAFSARNRELVVLEGNGRVSRFEARDRDLVYRDGSLLSFHPHDLCLLAGSLFVQGRWRGATIHRFDPEEGWNRSFGRPVGSDNDMLSSTLSRGLLACVPDPQLVVEMAKFHPVIRAYRPDGTRSWTDTVPGFRPIRVTEASPARVSFDWATPRGTHRVISLLPGTKSRLLVQLGVKDTSRTSPRDYRRVVTHVYDSRTGDRIGSTTGVRWLKAVRPPWAAAVAPLPYPRLLMLTTDSGRGGLDPSGSE